MTGLATPRHAKKTRCSAPARYRFPLTFFVVLLTTVTGGPIRRQSSHRRRRRRRRRCRRCRGRAKESRSDRRRLVPPLKCSLWRSVKTTVVRWGGDLEDSSVQRRRPCRERLLRSARTWAGERRSFRTCQSICPLLPRAALLLYSVNQARMSPHVQHCNSCVLQYCNIMQQHPHSSTRVRTRVLEYHGTK